MKNRKMKGIIVILLILGISNYFSGTINLFTEGIIVAYHFQSESGDFKFMAVPAKGRGIDMLEGVYENHLKKEGTEREEIYRTFKAQPLKFWNWYRYATHEMYRYPYKSA